MPSLDDYHWLVSDAAVPWLAKVRDELTESRGASVALLTRLRKDLSPERAHLVVEQCVLRERAQEKFSQADKMFFTRKGLEQATDEKIAEVKAARFPRDVSICDLCCGIGGDLVALAKRGSVVGIDLDPVAIKLAEANVSKLVGPAVVQAADLDVAEIPLADQLPWHIDPDRRADEHRTTSLEQYSPPLDVLERKFGENLNAAVKLAPATVVPPQWQKEGEREWFGSRGECRQQVCWFGSLRMRDEGRTATIVDARGGPRTISGSPTEGVGICAALGRYVYEPHAAVLAAHLTGAVCRMHELATVCLDIAYLTSDRLVDEPALDTFQVLDVLPLDEKQLRAYCRERALGRLEVKKRGIDIDPERLRKNVIADGDGAATLIVSPVKGVNRVIVARRVTPPELPSSGAL